MLSFIGGVEKRGLVRGMLLSEKKKTLSLVLYALGIKFII